MPIEFTSGTHLKKYNADHCEALGITIPEDYVAIG